MTFFMIEEIDPILIGELGDIDKDSVKNFEHEEIDYAIYHLEGVFLQLKVVAIVKSKLF